MNIDKMIQEVMDKADKVQARGKEAWPNDKSMIDMYKGDADDMRAGAELMKQGKFIEAHEKFSYMDTSAREKVPDNAWNYCEEKSEEHYRKKRDEKEAEELKKMSETTQYCIYCENEAEHVIQRSKAPICSACKEVYKAGQYNNHGNILEING